MENSSRNPCLLAWVDRFERIVKSRAVRDHTELVRLGHVTRVPVAHIMNLLNLAPDIQKHLRWPPSVCGIKSQNGICGGLRLRTPGHTGHYSGNSVTKRLSVGVSPERRTVPFCPAVGSIGQRRCHFKPLRDPNSHMAHGRFAGEQQSNACERSKEKSATLAYSNPRWPRAILGQVQLRSAPHRLVGFTQETAVMAAGRRGSFPDAFTRKAQFRTMPKTFGQRSNRASTGVSCSSATVALFLGRRIGIIGAVRPRTFDHHPKGVHRFGKKFRQIGTQG